MQYDIWPTWSLYRAFTSKNQFRWPRDDGGTVSILLMLGERSPQVERYRAYLAEVPDLDILQPSTIQTSDFRSM